MTEAQGEKKGPGDFSVGGSRGGAWVAGADSAKEDAGAVA